MLKMIKDFAWLAGAWFTPRVDLTATLHLWRRRGRTRAALSQLDAAQLRDIGLHPETARREAEKLFWQG